MISVFDYCLNNWPESIVRPQQQALSQIHLLTLPQDMPLLKKADKNKSIIVQNNASVFTAIQILKMGFFHCLDSSQPDFDREVLVSSLMMINSDILTEHKVPFFLKGLGADSSLGTDQSIVIDVTERSEVLPALNQLNQFIHKSNLLKKLPDVALFTADELLTNAIKAHARKNLANLPVQLFMGFDKSSFVIGCTDFAGDIDRGAILDTLLKEFSSAKITPQVGGDGAGIGLRLALEGASSLYIHSVANKKTIFCCGFKLKSIKSNSGQSKHLHFQAPT